MNNVSPIDRIIFNYTEESVYSNCLPDSDIVAVIPLKEVIVMLTTENHVIVEAKISLTDDVDGKSVYEWIPLLENGVPVLFRTITATTNGGVNAFTKDNERLFSTKDGIEWEVTPIEPALRLIR